MYVIALCCFEEDVLSQKSYLQCPVFNNLKVFNSLFEARSKVKELSAFFNQSTPVLTQDLIIEKLFVYQKNRYFSDPTLITHTQQENDLLDSELHNFGYEYPEDIDY